MSTLRERLEKKISDDEARYGRVGAASLIPLVCEMAEALEFYASINENEPSAALAVDKFGMARKALKAIEKFVGENV